MEGLRVVGKPADLAKQYAEDADELLYLDAVASLYGRNQLESVLESTTEGIFIPLTVGGGIRDHDTVRRLFRMGADKVAINTAAIRRPEFIRELADHYGSQAIVIAIEAKRTTEGKWEALVENGRGRSSKDAIIWAVEAVELGAGEILITSIDREGTRRGCDLDLIKAIVPNVDVPVIACGGIGSQIHVEQVAKLGACVAMSSALHTGKLSLEHLR